jgi:NADH-quinone oxidoreductase subunit G
VDVLKAAKRPMIILGQGALTGPFGAAHLREAGKLAALVGAVKPADNWNGFCVLHTAAARVGGLDLGFVPGQGGKTAAEMVAAMDQGAMDALFLLGADEMEMPERGTVIYLGSHGDRGAHRADIILPAAAYTEKNAIWVNTEGRVQFGQRAAFPKGDAREDWAILRALSERLEAKLPYDNLNALRTRLIADHPSFGAVDYAPGAAGAESFKPEMLGVAGTVSEDSFRSPIEDFYITNPIARASLTMAECSATRIAREGIAAIAAE